MASACAEISCALSVREIGDGDGDEDAVDRLARTVAAQQVEEAEPASLVRLGVGILRRVAAGGVDQDGADR